MSKISFYYKFYNVVLVIVLITTTSIFFKTKIDQQNLQSIYSHRYSHLEKKRVIIDTLESNLGFGGFIHQFKNYLLRANINDYQAAKKTMLASQALCEQYKSLQLSTNEQHALQSILLVLKQYQQNLTLIHDSFQKSSILSTQNLDTLVKVDDLPLIEAISLLKQVLLQDFKEHHLSEQELMAELLSSISLLLFLVLPLLLITWLFIHRIVSLKTKRLNHEIVINQQLLQELNLAASAFNAHEGILFTDPNRKIIKVNKAFCELSGYTEEELLGQSPELFSSDKQSLFFYAKLWHAVYAKGSWSGEIIDRKKNGEIFIVWLSIESILNDQGDIKYFLAHFTDLTAYKKTHAAFSRRIKVEKTISEVAILMLEANSENFDTVITNCLKLLTMELAADRGYLFSISSDSLFMSNTHEWCAEGIEPMINSLQAIEADQFSWLMEQLLQKKVVKVYDVNLLPFEASAEKLELQRQSIQSILLIPIHDGLKLTGYFGFDRVKVKRAWRDEDISLFKMIAEIFYLAQYRHQIDCENADYLKTSTDLSTKNSALLNENRSLANETIQRIEQERHFLAQELHDEMGQHITAIRMNAALLKTLPCTQDDEEILKIIKAIDNLTVKVIKNLRATILRIRSATLDHLGLVAGLTELVEEWLLHNQSIKVNTEFMDGLDTLDENTIITLYRVTQEALTNISKHAQAHNISIILKPLAKENDEQFLQLIISDDGVGINVYNEARDGFGLLGMKERILAINGTLSILENTNSSGTRLEFNIPFRQHI